MASKHNRRNGYVKIGAGRPPVPPQLAKKIESGVFIEMADLLPEYFGDKQKRCHRSKHSKLVMHRLSVNNQKSAF